MKRIRSAACAASRKWKSRSGESITEVLVALLISAVALVMLASMITASSRLITQSKDRMESYYKNSNSLADHGETGGGTVSTGVVRLTKAGEGESTVTVQEWDDVNYATNSSVKDPVVAYWPKPAPAGGEP